MTIKDLFITPLFLLLIYFIAYLVRPKVSDVHMRRYFIPGLTLKIIGGLAVGFIYQFYYRGGDTFTYFNLGSKYIWEAFLDNPMLALKLILAGEEYASDTFMYATRIYTYGDLASYFVVRVAGIFDILTGHTYSATAVLFAAVSFSGLWAMYKAFYQQYPKLHLYLAIAIFFVPSLFFWGSGILKDTITIGALGWATFSIYKIFFEKKHILIYSCVLLIAFYTIFTVKVYILLCFVPAAVLWIFGQKLYQIKNVIIRIMVAPFIISITILIGYYLVVEIGKENERYNLDAMLNTAQITAEWVHYVSLREKGSAYTLGDFDFSPSGILRKFPLAVWVSLYRPYLWEAHNIVMLLSALEAFLLLLLTVFVIYKSGVFMFFKNITAVPILSFCFLFSIMFAFSVGISTYNFGSLVRYKIPLLPFFISALFIALYHSKRARKVLRLD